MIGMDKINDRIRIFWVAGGIGSKNEGIQAETDLLGQKILFFNRAVHHDQTKKGNNYIVLDESEWGWEDVIEERTPQGEIVKTIAFGDILRKEAKTAEETNMIHRLIYDDKNIYHKNGNLKRTDYIHLNSVVYDDKTDILYLSSRHHGVFAVEYNTLSLLWWMADDSLKTKRGIGYGQIVPESLQLQDIPFLQAKRMYTSKGKGPKNQHSLFLRKNGNLLMFDNRGDEEHNIQGSKVIEYSFSGLSAAVVREFVHPEKVYARITSDVDVLPDSNILVFYASSSPLRVTEVDAANNIVFDMTFNMKVNMDGLENFEDVNIAYRADKMPLYPYKDENKKYSIENREE